MTRRRFAYLDATRPCGATASQAWRVRCPVCEAAPRHDCDEEAGLRYLTHEGERVMHSGRYRRAADYIELTGLRVSRHDPTNSQVVILPPGTNTNDRRS